MHQSTKRLTLSSILIALSCIFSYIESIFPISIGVPGIKIGLSNIVILFSLYLIDFKSAYLISLVRILIVTTLFGSPTMAIYSIAGTTASMFTMYILKKSDLFSIAGVSMAGGVVHNIAQLVVATITVNTIGLLSYMPILIIVGMGTGIFIGFFSNRIIFYIRNIFKLNNTN